MTKTQSFNTSTTARPRYDPSADEEDDGGLPDYDADVADEDSKPRKYLFSFGTNPSKPGSLMFWELQRGTNFIKITFLSILWQNKQNKQDCLSLSSFYELVRRS